MFHGSSQLLHTWNRSPWSKETRVLQGVGKEPQLSTIEVAKDHISRVIGPNGSVIRGIEDKTGAKVSIQDDGTLHYFAPSAQQARDVERAVGSITGTDVKVSHAAHFKSGDM